MITVELFTIGKKNVNGLVYTKEMAESIVSDINQAVPPIMGKCGSFGNDYPNNKSLTEEDMLLNLADVTHIVKQAYIKGGSVYVEFEFVENLKKGNSTRVLWELDKNDLFAFKPEGTGEVTEDKEIINYRVKAINFVKIKEELDDTV